MKQDVKVHVEQVILHGFDPGDRLRFTEALKLELTRLIVEQGLPSAMSQNGGFASLKGGTFHLSPNTKSLVVGKQIARCVYEGVGK